MEYSANQGSLATKNA